MSAHLFALMIPLTVAASIELSGRGRASGFLIGALVQVWNVLFGITSGAYWEFYLGPLLVGPAFLRQWLRWRRSAVAVSPRSGAVR